MPASKGKTSKRFGRLLAKLPYTHYKGRILRVAVQLQLRHIKDTPEYVRYVKQREARGEKYKVSKLKGDLRFAQQLINTYYSKGREEYNKSGELMETTFKANVVVGRVHDRVKDVWQKTKWGRIKYSGTGAHVFPVFSPHRPFR